MSSKQAKKVRKEFRKSANEINIELANKNIGRLYETIKTLTSEKDRLCKQNKDVRSEYRKTSIICVINQLLLLFMIIMEIVECLK